MIKKQQAADVKQLKSSTDHACSHMSLFAATY